MDLSDGSDVEGDYELDENALLGSDDEDAAHYSRVGFVTRAVAGGVYDEDHEEHIGHAEDSDVLDLELHDDDGLEFADEPDGCSSVHARLAPVRVVAVSNSCETRRPAAEPNTDGYQHQIPDNYEEYGDEYDDDHAHGVLDDEDDDDEDSRNTRTRFHSERNTDNLSGSSNNSNVSSNPNFGSPIQTLGSGKPPAMMDENRQRNWGRQNQNQGLQHSSSHHQGPRPRFHQMRNPLLGDRPHLNPNFNQFRPRGPRMNMNPNRPPMLHGRMFPGFNQPSRIPNPHCPPQMREPGPPPFPNQGGGCGPPRRPMHDPLMQQMQLQGQPSNNMNMNIQPMRQNNPRMQIRQQRPQMRPPRGGQTNMTRHPHPNNAWRNQRPPQFQRMPMNHPHGQPNNMHFIPGPQMFPPDAGNMFLDQQGIQHPEMPGVQFSLFSNMQMQQQQQQQQFPQQIGFPGGGNIGLSLMGPPEMHPVQNIPPQHPQQNPFFPQQPLQPQPHFVQQQQAPSSNPWPESQQPPPTNSWTSAPPTGPPLHIGLPLTNFNLHPALDMQSVPSGQNGSFVPAHQQIEQQGAHLISRSAEEDTPTYPRSSFERNAELYQQREKESHSHHAQDRHASRIEHDSARHERRGSPHERRSYEDRSYHDDRSYDDRRGYSRNDDRYPSKRKYARDSSPYGSPDKSQRSRDDRPSSPPPAPRDRKADELLKIREEAKKTIGLDDDYIRKLEDQKRLREEILRKKAASRRKLTGAEEPDTVSSSQEQERVPQKSAGRPSIYINPKAFRGDLSALKLKNVEQGTLKTTQIMHTNVAGITTKPRKVLKIVKDKYGNVLSKSKSSLFERVIGNVDIKVIRNWRGVVFSFASHEDV